MSQPMHQTETITWDTWEAFASTDPQPESRQLVLDPYSGLYLEAYDAPGGAYFVAWIDHGSGTFALQQLISDMAWHTNGKAEFLGAEKDDTASELVWWAPL